MIMDVGHILFNSFFKKFEVWSPLAVRCFRNYGIQMFKPEKELFCDKCNKITVSVSNSFFNIFNAPTVKWRQLPFISSRIPLADLGEGGKRGTRKPPPRPKISSFSCSFREDWPNNRLTPSFRDWRPSSGKTWIRHWILIQFFWVWGWERGFFMGSPKEYTTHRIMSISVFL